jgi:hypothetical protein
MFVKRVKPGQCINIQDRDSGNIIKGYVEKDPRGNRLLIYVAGDESKFVSWISKEERPKGE